MTGDAFTDTATSSVVDRPITRRSGRKRSAPACLPVDTDSSDGDTSDQERSQKGDSRCASEKLGVPHLLSD